MSDLMLYAVLRMPYDMAMGDELSRRQFYSRVQEVVDRMEAAEAKLEEIEAARRGAPVDLDAEGLPPLAKTSYIIEHYHDDGSVTCCDGYTVDQVRQAQRDAIAADRLAREKA